MVTERRVVTVLALASLILVGFLLYSGGEESTPVDRSSSSADTTTPSPTTTPTPTPTPTAAEPAVAPVGAGRCPKGARVKGETAESGERVYHRPGSANYADTRAEECFASAADAEAAGYVGADD